MKFILLSSLGLLSAAALLTQCTAPTGGGGGSLPPATKDAPFVNSLGMKFVPVPGTKILMCTTETTVAQYSNSGRNAEQAWFPQGADHPVVMVTIDDAEAWCEWIGRMEGKQYRLPTAKEWRLAASGSQHPWGNTPWPPASNSANYAGQELRSIPKDQAIKIPRNLFQEGGVMLPKPEEDFKKLIKGFTDHHPFTAPVTSYPPNHLGLYHMSGNVAEAIRDQKNRHYLPRLGADWSTATAAGFEDAVGYSLGQKQETVGFRVVIEP